MNRPIVIYHGNCADGFSAAWCFWRKYGTGADYVAGVYQKDPPDVTGRDVYLVDFSYKRAVVEQMLKAAAQPSGRPRRRCTQPACRPTPCPACR
ncbi:MAG: hypothetical protein KDF67_10500 [Ottowia sp.]|nr:hypothetical protein [Ottowia sp.]